MTTTWPDSPMLARLEVAWGEDPGSDPSGWSWADETAHWHVPGEVRLRWGGSYRSAAPWESAEFSVQVKNVGGRFTARDARSPLWPNVVKGTPLRWSVSFDDGGTWHTRFSGFIRKLPTAWPGNSGRQAIATITAGGPLHRLERSANAPMSPMRMTIGGSSPVAYWPLEDGEVAQFAASAVVGVSPMSITGSVTFAPTSELNVTGSGAGYDRYGTGSLVDLSSGASLFTSVPASVTTATSSAGEWSAHVIARVNPGESDRDIVIWEVGVQGGTYATWRLVMTTSFHTILQAVTAAGSVTDVIDLSFVPTSFTGFDADLTQNGGNIDCGLRWDHWSSSHDDTGSIAGTLGGVASMSINPTGAVLADDELPVGHAAIWATAPIGYLGRSASIDSYGQAAFGPFSESYGNEAAHLRLTRVCAETGIPITVGTIVDDIETVRMGRQMTATRLDLMAEIVRTELGILREGDFELQYIPRPDRFNQTVALTIDAAQRELSGPFTPDEDPTIVSQWTVSRAEGSFVTIRDGAVEARHGAVERNIEISLYLDDWLADHAGFRLWRDGTDEAGYPAIDINLRYAPHLVEDWLECREGSRVQVVNPPAQHSPDAIDQAIIGATEVWRGRRHYEVSVVCAPMRPWLVAEADGGAIVPGDGSTLAVGIDADDLSLSLTSTAENGLWSTDAANYPQDWRVGGERVTVSAVTGGSSPQAVTVSARAVNGVSRSWDAGTEIDVWLPAVASL